MAMPDRVQFSEQNQILENVALHHLDASTALIDFFSGNSPDLQVRYAGAVLADVRQASLSELDFRSSLAVLSSVEATVRIDYLRRVYARKKDPLSLAMRSIYKEKENTARLEEDLLHTWRNDGSISTELTGALIGAFKYRHWLAHGRYWKPKLGRKYDYITVYGISEEFIEAMEQYDEAH